jgi:hypothetical protein
VHLYAAWLSIPAVLQQTATVFCPRLLLQSGWAKPEGWSGFTSQPESCRLCGTVSCGSAKHRRLKDFSAKKGASMMDHQDSKWALDSEWYEDGKLRRVRVGRNVLWFFLLVMYFMGGRSPSEIWQVLEKLFK